MRLRLSLVTFLSILFALAVSSSASAAIIDCSTAGCLGGVYELDVERTGDNQYTATYTIDTTGDFDVNALYLNEVEFKVANRYADVSVMSGPDGALMSGPLSGRGCQGNGNAGFICLDLTPQLDVGDVYTWEITFSAREILDESEWHVGARYTNDRHRRGWVISESPATAIPEPAAAVLFGAGIVAAGSASRRRA